MSRYGRPLDQMVNEGYFKTPDVKLPAAIVAIKNAALRHIHENLRRPLSQQEPDPRVRLVNREKSFGGEVTVRSYVRRKPSR